MIEAGGGGDVKLDEDVGDVGEWQCRVMMSEDRRPEIRGAAKLSGSVGVAAGCLRRGYCFVCWRSVRWLRRAGESWEAERGRWGRRQ